MTVAKLNRLWPWVWGAVLLGSLSFVAWPAVEAQIQFDMRGEPLGGYVCPDCGRTMGAGSRGPQCFWCSFPPTSGPSAGH